MDTTGVRHSQESSAVKHPVVFGPTHVTQGVEFTVADWKLGHRGRRSPAELLPHRDQKLAQNPDIAPKDFQVL